MSCWMCKAKPFLVFWSFCIWERSTPKGPTIFEPDSRQPSWKTRKWRIQKKSKNWLPEANLSSKNWKPCTSSENTELWNNDTTRTVEHQPVVKSAKACVAQGLNGGWSACDGNNKFCLNDVFVRSFCRNQAFKAKPERHLLSSGWVMANNWDKI